MMQAVVEALAHPEVILYMTDVGRTPYPDLAFLQRQLGRRRVPVFWGLNKIDLVPPRDVLPLIAACQDKEFFAEIFPLAARRGDNVSALLESLVRYLPEGPRYFPADMPTDRDERFLMAELIREQAILHTHEEVPYSIAVEVEALQERADGGVEIDACVVVEKESQKAIVIGAKGHMIKTIGTQARQAISRLLNCPVHLRLFVRVKKGWQEHDALLRDLGYGERS
jgi:GTP-binding protein Era